jgi:hypothetical protein
MIPKRPRDPNQLAKAIIDITTDDSDVPLTTKTPLRYSGAWDALRLCSSLREYGATRREVDVKGK